MSFPLPGRTVGDRQLGVDGGVTLTRMTNAHVGVGVDFLYHYWPTSAGYKSAYDRHLMRARFETITGSDWALTTFQGTGHVKLVPWPGARPVPWLRAGAGVYRVGRNLVETRPPDTYAYYESLKPVNAVLEAGAFGSIGFDVRSSSRIALGLDATYHHLWSATTYSGKVDMPNFSAFTIGAHVLFGWE